MIQRALIVSALLLAGAVYMAMASGAEPVPIRSALHGFPLQIGEWRGQDAPAMDSRVLEVLGVEDHIDRYYIARRGSQVGLYIGYYASQRQGDTIHSPLNCLPGAGWNPVKKARRTITVSLEPGFSEANGNMQASRTIEVNLIVIQKGTDEQVVIYWYHSRGRVIASEYWGKIYTVLDAIRTNRTDAALVRVITPAANLSPEAEETAERHATEFVKDIFPLLGAYLPD